MPKGNFPIQKFNRGRISPRGLARADLENYPFFAEDITNWRPSVLGCMMLRPGLGYIGATRNNSKAFHIPFIFSNSDTAIIELTDQVMRVRVNEAIVTRGSVSSSVTNGTFGSNITSWTDADDSGCTSAWVTGGYAGLTGTKFNYARLRQEITVSGGDANDEHAIRIVVTRGEVTFRAGTTAGAQDYISQTVLLPGTHSLTLTPTGNFHIEIASNTKYQTLVDSVSIESPGAMEIATPWLEADMKYIKYAQSRDVIFLACKGGYVQKRIERRSTNSWSVVDYVTEDGPFRTINTGQISLTPSAISGDITLTSSQALFRSTNVGSMFKIESIGQQVTQTVSAENQFSSEIKVTGTGSAQRSFTVTRTGTFTATVTLQRSIGEPGNWIDVATYTTAASSTYNDGLSNQDAYYRIGVKTGDFTSGPVVLDLDYETGSISGVVKITAYSSETSVSAIVLKDLGGTASSTNWYESRWSPRRGYPTSVRFYDGRLCWSGQDQFDGSVSDAYSSFDSDVEGDSGRISRSIGGESTDTINWMLDLQRLILGAEGAEYAVKTTSLDEPISPTNFNIKSPSTVGSSYPAALKVDSRGYFVDKSGRKLYQLVYDINVNDFIADDTTKLVPEIGGSEIVRIGVQRTPNTIIHCIKSDGTVANYIIDPAENVKCYVDLNSTGASGLIEDIVVLPGTEEDKVYYTVKRTINGNTVRYLEKFAMESECQGGTLNKQADSFISVSQSSSATITGLSTLEGQSVVVWANGKDLGTYTVASGSITVSEAVTTAIVGLTYRARFKSSKLAYAAGMGTALNQRKRPNALGFILYNTHYQGLKYGQEYDYLDDLPLVGPNDEDVAAHTIYSELDIDLLELNSSWDTDARICLEANAPRPCTVLGVVLQIQTNDKG